MSGFFIFLIGFFIVVANVMGFVSYKKQKNLYHSAFTLLISAVLFGAIGGGLALLMIRDPFAIFYGLQVGHYLLINSMVVFITAILITAIKRFRKKAT